MDVLKLDEECFRKVVRDSHLPWRSLNSSPIAFSMSHGYVGSGPRTTQVTAAVVSHSRRSASMSPVDWMR